VDFDSWPVIRHRELVRIEDESGKTLVLHTDPAELEAHLRARLPTGSQTLADSCITVLAW
jgi:hypothetical protein